MTLIYVDVSHHDWDRHGGQLDWAKIKTATSGVMCARATYGDPSGYSPDSRHFGDFQNGAKAAGFVLRGGYHNLVRGDAASMKRQVAWFRSELDRYGCHWAMVDIERYAELVSNGLWPRWDDVRRFRDAWHAVENRPLAYYLPKWLVDGYYGTADLRELPGPLIQSHYAGGDGTAQQIYATAGGDSGTGWDDRYGSRLPDIWQYTSSGNVPGASGNTDCNAFRSTLAQLTALLTGDDMTTADDVWNHDVRGEAGTQPAWVVLQNTQDQGIATGKDVKALLAAVAELAARPAAQLTDAQIEQLAARIIAADNPLGDADRPVIVAAVKQALAEGVA